MSTTTVTTGSPPLAKPCGVTVRQRVSQPSVAEAVQQRICELHDRNKRAFTAADFEKTAKRAGRPLSWIGDHLIILEGLGILHPVRCSTVRTWSIDSGSEYLR